MVYLVPLITLLVLLPTSQATFNALSGWKLYEVGFDSTQNKFGNTKAPTYDLGPSDSTVTLEDLVGCASTSLSAQTWWLEVDLTQRVGSPTTYAVSFWAYFDSTISDKAFQFGDPDGAHHVVSSTTNGKLDFTFYQDATIFDTNNNFSTTVPLKTWFAIIFYFVTGPPVTMKVAVSNQSTLSQTSVQSSTAPFAMPSTIIQFGKAITGKFYQLWVSDSFTEVSSTALSLMDSNSQLKALSIACISDACSDASCLDGDGCISAMTTCQSCNSDTCNTCATASRDPAYWCQVCTSGSTFKNAHCNFYLGCADSNNCDQCAEIGTLCTVCPADHYLFDETSTSTTCVACVDSCDYCATTNCFLCAEAIALDDTTCRVDSVGYTAKYVAPDIVLNFASKLPYGLAFNSITATSNSGTSINTSGWTLSGCTKGVNQCKIVVPNSIESSLPIDMEFEFTQTS